MEYFDETNEKGEATGRVVSRQDAHKYGYRHNVIHIWIVNDKGEILLQRRSKYKDSYPNMYDVSCAGHIEAGNDKIETAIRELKEELDIDVTEAELEFAFMYNIYASNDVFVNNENAYVYVLFKNLDTENIKLQEEEVSEVKYFKLEELKVMAETKSPQLVAAGLSHIKIIDYLKEKHSYLYKK